MIPQHFGILAALLPLAGFASYIRDTLRGRTQPNRVSWSLWALAPLIAFAAELAQHASPYAAALSFTLGLGPALVVLASFRDRRSYWQLGRLDVLCGALSVTALALWAVTGRGNVAIFLAIAADLLAAVPTIAKAWRHPSSESAGTYLASGAGGVLAVLAAAHRTFAACGFAGYVAVVCGIILLILVARPARLWSARPRYALRAVVSVLAGAVVLAMTAGIGFELGRHVETPAAAVRQGLTVRTIGEERPAWTMASRSRPYRREHGRQRDTVRYRASVPARSPQPSRRPSPAAVATGRPSPSPRPSPAPDPSPSPSPTPSPAPTPTPTPSPSSPSPGPSPSPTVQPGGARD